MIQNLNYFSSTFKHLMTKFILYFINHESLIQFYTHTHIFGITITGLRWTRWIRKSIWCFYSLDDGGFKAYEKKKRK